MILGNFNGTTVIALPPTPGFSSLTVKRRNTVGSVTSPFSMQTQLQAWMGADRWEGHAVLPPMARDQAAPWDAWLAECQGMLNGFHLPIPFNGKPLSGGASAPGVPVVNGAGGNAAGANMLYTRGWTPSRYRLMLNGDYIQVGPNRLYTILDPVASDASGNAAITIWPSLREVPSDGTAIALHDTTGLFRMASNEQEFSVDESGIWRLEFDFVEVR